MQALYAWLRQGLELCGILKNVYGFARFSNVKDVGKLIKALNEVQFGPYHIFAKVACFDRYVVSKKDDKENGEFF